MWSEAHLQARPPPKPVRPAGSPDVLTRYLEQLRHIPLYTPAQELDGARQLEEQELAQWRPMLAHPGAQSLCQRACAAAGHQITEPVRTAHLQLQTCFARAAKQGPGRVLAPSPYRQALIEQLAGQLRYQDFDKELFESVLAIVRRRVWARQVMGSHAAYRLTHDDLTTIERARASAQKTRNDFVRANLRLVVSVARHFHHYKVPLIDLVQEGNVGLMKAVHRFDHRRGFRFSTYAHWWIRQSIERAIINKGSQVRLPVHVIDARRQVQRSRRNLMQALGRTPTHLEVAKDCQMPLDRVEQLATHPQPELISLDSSLGGDNPRKVVDLVRDDSRPGIDEALIRQNSHDRIKEMLYLLGPIERDIIRRRFGLGDGPDQTLDEIGRIYSLSRERVRQIQAQSLAKVRRMCERRRIR